MMTKKAKKNLAFDLDAYEQEIEDRLPDFVDKLPVTENLDDEIADAREAADKYLRKNKKINIRLSEHDVEGLKRIAVREGMPYQTLIASVLHKYVRKKLNINL